MDTLISEKWVKTRKSHKCFGCANEYPKGFYMYRSSVVDCSTVCVFYLCEVCQEYEARYVDCYDYYGYGDLYKEDPISWEELRQEMLKEENGK